jgi:hypothetical protein
VASGCSQRQPAYEPALATTPAALADTAVVPTLDTPIARESNAVWCATFQLAWQQLRRTGLHECADQPTAQRLNAATIDPACLPADARIAVGAGEAGKQALLDQLSDVSGAEAALAPQPATPDSRTPRVRSPLSGQTAPLLASMRSACRTANRTARAPAIRLAWSGGTMSAASLRSTCPATRTSR